MATTSAALSGRTSPACSTPWSATYLGWAQFLAPVVMKNGERPELEPQELEESFCSTDPDIVRRFAEATFFADNRADLRASARALADPAMHG